MMNPTFEDRPPDSEHFTAYDEMHLVTYLRLLDAAAEGASWSDVAQIIFGLDPVRDGKRARVLFESHLARAQWMARNGYRQLPEQD